jgi:UDP-N-acetyl-D-galactosamine dehydrogenase
MGEYVARQVVKRMLKNDLKIKNADNLVLGMTFKENCPDVRNTKAVDVVKQLQAYETHVDIFDPWATPAEVEHEYNLQSFKEMPSKKYEAIVLCVAHKEFVDLDLDSLKKENAVVYDVKGILGDKCDAKL